LAFSPTSGYLNLPSFSWPDPGTSAYLHASKDVRTGAPQGSIGLLSGLKDSRRCQFEGTGSGGFRD
jgi:hypothetical protein